MSESHSNECERSEKANKREALMATEKFPIHDTDSTGQADILTEAMETEEESLFY